MAAPKHVPLSPTEHPRTYSSPDHVPDGWLPDRPADLQAGQPEGATFGYQGPDQGYGLLLAERFRDRLALSAGESATDVIAGCFGIAVRRASMYGRAPVIHDFDQAFTMWGFLDASAPAELVMCRRKVFEGLALVHHYSEQRRLADQIPEATLRMTPAQVRDAYGRGDWATMTGTGAPAS